MINFSEIGTPHRWEQFAESFFEARGAVVIQRVALGQDRGADLIIEEYFDINGENQKKRILVSCKHMSKPVGIDIENDIRDRLDDHNCVCFYGFYSSYQTLPLQQRLDNLKEHGKIQDYHIFHDYEIESFLKNNLDNNLFKNNFENSYNHFIGNTKKAIEENTNFQRLSSEDIRDKNNESFKEFYSGGLPHWDIIKKHTFKRDIFDTVISNLDKNKVALVTAAGGEGKTTFLMQVGCYFFENKYEVYYSFDGIQNINLNQLQFDKRKNYALIIDQANYLEDIVNFIQIVKLKNNVKLLLAARKNEWLQFVESAKNYKDIQILIGTNEFSLSKLSLKEIASLKLLLTKHGALYDGGGNSLEEIISSDSNSFLLATMLLATKGQKFEFYISDVINHIRQWDNGYVTLKAIGYIVACEVLGRGYHGTTYCSEKLLQRLIDLSNEKFHFIKRHLAAETFFQQNAERFIHTRNPLIAQLYFDILFIKEPIEFGIEDYYADIIHHCSILNNKIYMDIIASIPPYLRKLDRIEASIRTLKTCISYGYFFKQFIVFIKDEIEKQNIGDYENYSARMLCKIACDKNPFVSEFYVEWAKLETNYGELGDFTKENTVRWIYKLGFDRKAGKQSFYVAWASIEIKVGNIGDIEGEQEFTARWLLRKEFKRKFDIKVGLVLARLELKAGNFGTLAYQPEFSARWILKKCIENNRILEGDIYLMWARIEIQLNNIGEKDFKTTYTARWLLQKAFSAPVVSGANLHWAKLEIRENNLGDDKCNDPYTARWILKESLLKINNDTEKIGFTIYWAKVEAQNNNYGNYQMPYSALFLLKSLYNQNLMTSTGFIIWSAIQYYLNVSESDEFSSLAMFMNAKKLKDKLFFQEYTFENFEDWINHLKSNSPETIFKPAGFHYQMIDI